MKNNILPVESHLNTWACKILDAIVSFLILVVLIAFLFFMAAKALEIGLNVFNFNFEHIVHEVIYFIVFVKVYKIVSSYFQYHHINVKYILEISIIAPMIEVIFMTGEKSWWVTSVFVVFSILSLLLYLIFYEKIQTMH